MESILGIPGKKLQCISKKHDTTACAICGFYICTETLLGCPGTTEVLWDGAGTEFLNNSKSLNAVLYCPILNPRSNVFSLRITGLL